MKKFLEEDDIVITKDDLIDIIQDDPRTEDMDEDDFLRMIDDIARGLKFDLKKDLKAWIDDWMIDYEEKKMSDSDIKEEQNFQDTREGKG